MAASAAASGVGCVAGGAQRISVDHGGVRSTSHLMCIQTQRFMATTSACVRGLGGFHKNQRWMTVPSPVVTYHLSTLCGPIKRPAAGSSRYGLPVGLVMCPCAHAQPQLPRAPSVTALWPRRQGSVHIEDAKALPILRQFVGLLAFCDLSGGLCLNSRLPNQGLK